MSTLRESVYGFVSAAGREVSVAEVAEAVGVKGSTVSAALALMLKDPKVAKGRYPGLRKVRKGVFVVGGRAATVKNNVHPVEVVNNIPQEFEVEDAVVLRRRNGRRYLAYPIN